MAQIQKANGVIDWLDQRIAIRTLTKVLMTEYWIPKNINFLWAMGIVLVVLPERCNKVRIKNRMCPLLIE